MNAAKMGEAAFGLVLVAYGISFARDHLNGHMDAPGIDPPAISELDLPDMPDMPRPLSGKHVASFYADAHGLFWINGTANGAAFRFMADTGSTGIAFSKQDARRLGLDLARLSFDGSASTANGEARTASARIARLQIGPFTLANAPVSIIDSDLDSPLLGMAFLRRLHVVIGNGLLTLSDGA